MEDGPMHSRQVGVSTLALVVALAGTAMAGQVEGRIEAVNPVSKEILLDTGVALATNELTTIVVDGQPSGFQSVKEGAKVRASYEEKDGKNVATALEIHQ
jgi:hypothetical protein